MMDRSPDRPPMGGIEVESFGRSGRFGDLWRGRAPDGREVSLKLMKPELFKDGEAIRRFQREVRLLLAFEHPGLLRVLDHGTTASGDPYLVLESVEGQILSDVVARGPLPFDRGAHHRRPDRGRARRGRVAGHRPPGPVPRRHPAARRRPGEGSRLRAGGRRRGVRRGGAGGCAGRRARRRAAADRARPTHRRSGLHGPRVHRRLPVRRPGPTATPWASCCTSSRPAIPRSGAAPRRSSTPTSCAPPPAPSERMAGIAPWFDALMAALLAKDPAARPTATAAAQGLAEGRWPIQ